MFGRLRPPVDTASLGQAALRGANRILLPLVVETADKMADHISPKVGPGLSMVRCDGTELPAQGG